MELSEIADAVRIMMPDATDAELKEAAVTLREFLNVAYWIYLRHEREGTFDRRREKDRFKSTDEQKTA